MGIINVENCGFELGVVKYTKIDQWDQFFERDISFIDLAVVEINVVKLQ